MLKNDIVLGSDKSAEVELKRLPGFYARLDFRTKELQFITEDRTSTLDPGALVTLADYYVIQWKTIKIIPTHVWWAALLFVLGLLFFGFFAFHHFGQSAAAKCTLLDRKIAGGEWKADELSDLSAQEKKWMQDLASAKKSFQEAIRQNLFVKARGDLHYIETLLRSRKIWPFLLSSSDVKRFCDISQPLQILHWRYSEKLIGYELKQKNTLSAAKELSQIQSSTKGKTPEVAFDLEERILHQADQLYLKDYRLEDDDPENGAAFMAKAESVCRELHFPRHCFQASSVVTSQKKHPRRGEKEQNSTEEDAY